MPKDLIEQLEDLRLLLEKAQTERYNFFCENSEYGKDCRYAMKAKDLFEQFHAEDIEKLIVQINDTFYEKE